MPMLSAYVIVIVSGSIDKSYMYILSGRRPRSEPYGTPASTSLTEIFSFSSCTRKVWLR